MPHLFHLERPRPGDSPLLRSQLNSYLQSPFGRCAQQCHSAAVHPGCTVFPHSAGRGFELLEAQARCAPRSSAALQVWCASVLNVCAGGGFMKVPLVGCPAHLRSRWCLVYGCTGAARLGSLPLLCVLPRKPTQPLFITGSHQASPCGSAACGTGVPEEFGSIWRLASRALEWVSRAGCVILR